MVSIHAPRAGCDFGSLTLKSIIVVSIHAPRAGCDDLKLALQSLSIMFQSTHPARGATELEISWLIICVCFNPRTPRGVRRKEVVGIITLIEFQSTHPARGATNDR